MQEWEIIQHFILPSRYLTSSDIKFYVMLLFLHAFLIELFAFFVYVDARNTSNKERAWESRFVPPSILCGIRVWFNGTTAALLTSGNGHPRVSQYLWLRRCETTYAHKDYKCIELMSPLHQGCFGIGIDSRKRSSILAIRHSFNPQLALVMSIGAGPTTPVDPILQIVGHISGRATLWKSSCVDTALAFSTQCWRAARQCFCSGLWFGREKEELGEQSTTVDVGHPTSTRFLLAQRWSTVVQNWTPKHVVQHLRTQNTCLMNEELVYILYNHTCMYHSYLEAGNPKLPKGSNLSILDVLLSTSFTWLTKISISISRHFFSHTGELGENAWRNPSLAKSLQDKQRWYSSFRRVREEDERKSALLAEKTDLCTWATNVFFFQIQVSAVFWNLRITLNAV